MERSFFDWVVYILQKYGMDLLKGTGTTMLIAVVGTIVGFLIGLLIGSIRTIPVGTKDKPIKNRIFSIDLNPNYVGWSITDWKSSSEYKVIKTGVISIKDINDYDNSLKKASSSDKRKFYINNNN